MIIESLRDGGKQRQVEELVRMLALRDQYRILLLILKNDIHFDRILKLPNVDVYHLKRRFKKDPGIFLSFYRKARSFTPDLVHSWGGLPSLVSLPFVLVSGVPLVNEMVQNSRAPFMSVQWLRARLSFPFSSVIIGNSRIGLDVYNVPSKKSRLVRNGMNTDRVGYFSEDLKAGTRRHFSIGSGQKVVGMVATIDERKNFPMFVRSALRLLKLRRDIVFFVVGDGQERPKIESMVPEDESPNFVFTGRIKQVEEVVNIFDVAVLASFGEGTSNSLLEYMLLKKPVVVTNVDGINEVIRDDWNGFLVDQDDERAMAEKIGFLLDRPEAARRMGEAGHQYVMDHCSIESMVQSHEDIYREVTEKHRGGVVSVESKNVPLD